MAAAPSLMPLALPAVTLPSLRNTGFSAASLSAVVAFGCSSVAKATVSRFTLTSIGTIWLSKRPALIAAAARVWLSSAKASCSAREIWCSSATFSAVTPMWPVPNGQVSAPVIMSSARTSPIFWPQRASGRM